MNTNIFTLGCIDENSDILPFIDIVRSVRAELAEKYDVLEGKHKNYTGLCHEGTTRIMELCKEQFPELECDNYHGELARHPRVKSSYWPLQHDWCSITTSSGKIVYMDATSEQFQEYFIYMPEYIVSYDKPYWFYSDRSNPSWNGWTKTLNEKVKVPVRRKHDGKIFKDGIVDALQYEVWGRISDLIGKVFKLNK